MAKRQAAKRPAGQKSKAKKARTTQKATQKKTASPSPVRTTYTEAVAAYGSGLEALQRQEYERAQETLESILTDYPDERELHDRVRLYLQVCERQQAAPVAKSRTVSDRLYAATMALNAGNQEEALELLAAVQADEPDNDHAIYMLGVTQSVKGDHEAGLDYLRRAIALNPDNRALAKHDPELETLRSTDAFWEMLETAVSSSGRRGRARG